MSIDYTLKNDLGITLKEEQNEIVEALLKNDFYFNCAQTGIGKTLSTLTAAIYKVIHRKDEDIHFVLILPNSAVKAFTDTMSKQLGVPYNIYTATLTRTMPNARFHIFNYTTLSDKLFKAGVRVNTNNYFEILKKLYSKHKKLWLIADEAHALQNPGTNQYMMVKEIRNLFTGIWFLTATPILNGLDGLFHMTELVKPGFFGSYYRFRNKYQELEAETIWKTHRGKAAPKKVFNVVGYKNLDHLQEEFAKISIIRAKEYDFEILYRKASLSDSMSKFYKYAAAGLFSGTIINGKVKKSKQQHAGARLHDLQRVVSNSHPNFKAVNDPSMLTEKEVLLITTIKEVLERNEAVLVYFSYIESVERIKFILNKLKGKLKIPTIHEVSGKIKQRDRKKVEDAIKPRDIVLITSAGTESVNLQKANNLIFYEIPFPLREFIQACGRITRTNSKYDKFLIYILEAAGTIDTYKKQRIMSNMIPIKTVVGGSNILPTDILVLDADDKKAMKEELLWWK